MKKWKKKCMEVPRTHHYLAAEHSEITAYCFSYKSYVTEG